ncbi:BatA domain-containing protein [Rhodopirellula sp. P2]|uniref:BatA domain-containing protein n=1 Tax=Rhodopirellula sp. P2 TaxID=2127060 RepID=UPI002367BD9A|nr:BatA domain-containing protein [Rhodopirellula sp. P2]WDQ15869.1 BatA domain-containing protein [Rhodopirellula sp. P2]
MFLYPALSIGFAFVAVPLLVHLINLLRHRRTKWAAMDFLLASYRKQRRWIVLRQLLLLLSRLAVAALLIALLAGLVGGRQWIGALGGQTTHHVIVLDDSYSMQQIVSRRGTADDVADAEANGVVGNTAYDRALASVAGLVKRLAADGDSHTLTVMRASRAAMVASGENASADVAADLSAQTISPDGRQVERLMATRASSLRTDLVSAIDLASDLIAATTADSQTLYVVSDFTQRDWAAPRRMAEALESVDQAGAKIQMIDCVPNQASNVTRNLAITDLTPSPDVWVAGVPVVINVTVKNYSPREVNNVALSASVITYGDQVTTADPTLTVSGEVQNLPVILIDSIPGGQQLTKSFQIFVNKVGTHVVQVDLPADALQIDNSRVCTIPLADAQRVLVIDGGDSDAIGAYHVSSVLDPGSQVRIGAIPEVQPVTMLRDVTVEQLSRYRAVYLIDVPELSKRAVDSLKQYVQNGGGLAWFLGDDVNADNYNTMVGGKAGGLLPFDIAPTVRLGDETEESPRLVLGKNAELLGPIASAGNGIFGLVSIRRQWVPARSAAEELREELAGNEPVRDPVDVSEEVQANVRTLLARADETPVATLHGFGRGRVVTVTTGLDGNWNNWPGDPTFVVFLLQTNAMLFSGAAPPTSRMVDSVAEIDVPSDSYLPTVVLLPPADEPPRLEIELEAAANESSIQVSPRELIVADQAGLDELLVPGTIEWQRTGTDGQTSVLPVASVLNVGESDLTRVTSAEVIRDLLPLEVEFLSPGDWGDTGVGGGMSTFLLVLLALLMLMLAIEQALAAWASYHVRPTGDGASGSRQRRGVRSSPVSEMPRPAPRGRSRKRTVGASSHGDDDSGGTASSANPSTAGASR